MHTGSVWPLPWQRTPGGGDGAEAAAAALLPAGCGAGARGALLWGGGWFCQRGAGVRAGRGRFPAGCSLRGTRGGDAAGVGGAAAPAPHSLGRTQNGAKVPPSYPFPREAEGRQNSASGCLRAGGGAVAPLTGAQGARRAGTALQPPCLALRAAGSASCFCTARSPRFLDCELQPAPSVRLVRKERW